MDRQDFYERVMGIVNCYEDKYNGDMESYLLNIWKEVQEKKEEDMNAEVFFDIIEKGFKGNGDRKDLPSDWRDYEEAQDCLEDEFKGINSFKKILLFQIADVIKIKEEELEDKFPYSEIISPTGNGWNNFKPAYYLECAARGITDAFGGLRYEWKDFALFLEMGRRYE